MWGTGTGKVVTDENCPRIRIEECEVNGVKGERYNGGPCWMIKNQGSPVQYDQTSCPSGWKLPAKDEFELLVAQAGSGACLYSRGWKGNYWSSTDNGNSGCGSAGYGNLGGRYNIAYYQWGLYVNSSSASTMSLHSYGYAYDYAGCTSGQRGPQYQTNNYRCYAD